MSILYHVYASKRKKEKERKKKKKAGSVNMFQKGQPRLYFQVS